jgi:hypothetical protein
LVIGGSRSKGEKTTSQIAGFTAYQKTFCFMRMEPMTVLYIILLALVYWTSYMLCDLLAGYWRKGYWFIVPRHKESVADIGYLYTCYANGVIDKVDFVRLIQECHSCERMFTDTVRDGRYTYCKRCYDIIKRGGKK